MIIFNEDKYSPIQLSECSHRKSSKSAIVSGEVRKKKKNNNNGKIITKQNNKKLSRTNSKFLKSLGFTLKKQKKFI